MATQNLQRIEVVGTVSGNAPQTIGSIPEAALQTYSIGDVLTRDSNGRVAIATSDEEEILGVALEDGDNDTSAGTSYPLFAVANHDTIFAANVWHGTAASAVTAITHVGTAMELVLDTARFHLDLTVYPAVARRCLILELDPRDTVADIYGRLRFKFLTRWCVLGVTS